MNPQSITLFNWVDAHPAVALLIIVWSLAWKGFALWKAAALRQKFWFIVILVLNTLGLLEIVYLFLIARRYKVEEIEIVNGK